MSGIAFDLPVPTRGRILDLIEQAFKQLEFGFQASQVSSQSQQVSFEVCHVVNVSCQSTNLLGALNQLSVLRIGDTDRYFIMNEVGDLVMAKMTPEKFESLGRFHVLEPTGEAFGRDVVWSHPAYAEKTLFARNDKEIVAVDLAK